MVIGIPVVSVRGVECIEDMGIHSSQSCMCNGEEFGGTVPDKKTIPYFISTASAYILVMASF